MHLLLYAKFIDTDVKLLDTNRAVRAFVVEDTIKFQSTVALSLSLQSDVENFTSCHNFPILRRLSLSALDGGTLIIPQHSRSMLLQRLETHFIRKLICPQDLLFWKRIGQLFRIKF